MLGLLFSKSTELLKKLQERKKNWKSFSPIKDRKISEENFDPPNICKWFENDFKGVEKSFFFPTFLVEIRMSLETDV